MYESLTPDDEETLEEYISQGLLREEAILMIFEEKFNIAPSTKSKKLAPIAAMPTIASKLVKTKSSVVTDPPMSEINDPEVQKLIDKGYTPEQAVKLIKQKGSSGSPDQRHQQHHHYNVHRHATQVDAPDLNRTYQNKVSIYFYSFLSIRY